MNAQGVAAHNARIDADIAACRFRQRILRSEISCLKTMRDWIESEAPVLQKNECSRLHRLIDALTAGLVFPIWGEGELKPLDGSEAGVYREDNHVFVVKHDWLGVLGDENIPDETEFKLPFPVCTFEFRISDRNVVVIVCQSDEELVAVGFQESENGLWFSGQSNDRESPAMRLAWKQIKATCAVIDAEVASHTVIRAPSKLNAKRESRGKTRLFDFHVVDLSRRHRIANASSAHGTGSKKRLHFRRGHWRHYVASKTWVRWCLVGDPNLGFVDKEYAL